MKKFAIKMLSYLLPLLIMSSIMESYLRAIPNDYQFKKAYLEENSNEINTLILGNSHSFYGLNPDYFQGDCFNASHISQTLEYDAAILKKFEQNLSELNTVILNISTFSLFFDFETADEAWRNKNYVLYYNMNSANSYKDYSEVLSMRFSVNARRLYNYWYNGKTISCSQKGWGIGYSSERSQNLEKTAKKSAENHNVKDFNNFSKNKKHLNFIIEWCKKRKVKLLLYTAPAVPKYCQLINKEQLKTSLDYIEKIIEKHQHCHYLNLLQRTDFVEGDFYDADHLNEKGVEKLSLMLSSYIEEK